MDGVRKQHILQHGNTGSNGIDKLSNVIANHPNLTNTNKFTISSSYIYHFSKKKDLELRSPIISNNLSPTSIHTNNKSKIFRIKSSKSDIFFTK